jgi:hypothetical protein
LESWETEGVKVTLDLPSDLVREMELQAAREGRKLNDFAEQIFRRAFVTTSSPSEAPHRKARLPLIECRHAPMHEAEVSPERMSSLLLEQDVAAVNEVARR